MSDQPRPRIAVVVFPGSNDDGDAVLAFERLGAEAFPVWHAEPELPSVDAVGLPGGFSYGDYLRCGAIARFAPVMRAVTRFAGDGGLVLGICNGFQVLCEAGLLPGALRKNAGLKFLCKSVEIRVETERSVLTSEASIGQVLTIPINHFEGSYTCDEGTLAALRADERIVFRYLENPNGALDDIAGVCSQGRNVVGLMPHPERASHALLGSTDGNVLLRSLLAAAKVTVRG